MDKITYRKNFTVFYKNLSSLYGNMNIKTFIRNKTYKVLNFKILSKDNYVNKFIFNSNSKKILESKENLTKDLQELTSVTDNFNLVNLLKQEIKRKDVFLKKFGNFLVFKYETEHKFLKSKIELEFFYSFNKNKSSQEKRVYNLVYGENIPIFFQKTTPKISDHLYFHCSLRIFPFSMNSNEVIRIFRKLVSITIKSKTYCQVNWIYLRGFIFRCSIIYFFSQFDPCENRTFKKINFQLKLSFFYTLYVKTILNPTLYTIIGHLKKLELGNNLLMSSLKCSKLKKNRGFIFTNFVNNLSIYKLLYSRSNKWIIESFGNLIQNKFYKITFSEKKQKNMTCLLNFYSFDYRKFLSKTHLKLVQSMENFGGVINFKKLQVKVKKKLKIVKNNSPTKIFFPSKNFFLSIKDYLLFSEINKNGKLCFFIKLDKKKSNFEIATYSTRSYIGINTRVIIAYSLFFKILLPLKIKSKLQFFRVLVYNKRSENFESNLLFYPLFSNETKLANIHFRINCLLNSNNKLLRKQIISFVSNCKFKYIKRFFHSHINVYYWLNNNPFFFLVFILNSYMFKLSVFRYFSIFKNPNNLSFYWKKNIKFSFLAMTFFYLGSTNRNLDYFKKIIYKPVNKNWKKKFTFFQKINIEFLEIVYCYSKKKPSRYIY